MKRYAIESVAAHTVPLTGEVIHPWTAANELAIEEYPWYESGEKQATRVRLLYDEDALYVQFQAEDRHSYAETTELNGPVWEDSCVEVFVCPEPHCRPHYVNVEVNCVGALLMGWGPGRTDRTLISPSLADEIAIETSVPGPTKEVSPDDDGWWAAAKLPFSTLETFTGTDLAPAVGTEWRGNCYRCGGRTDPQYAAWNPIEAPEPDFHRPEEFGKLVFS